MEQNFNPGLALIGLSATGPRYTANGNRQIQEFLKVENELITVTAPKILMDKNPDINDFDKTTITYPDTPLAYKNN